LLKSSLTLFAAGQERIRRQLFDARIIGCGAKRVKRNILTAVVLLGIVGLLVAFAMPEYRQGESSISGTTARDFDFILDGKLTHLSDLRGKVVVLNFWATWCPPCVEETPSLNALQSQIAPQGGVVLGISLDDDASAYERFLTDNHVTFPTYRDTTKKIAAGYGTRMYPETYLIDRQGKIARKIIGPQSWDEGDMLLYVQGLLIQK
jgi:cytochrome c biogenesis protein CcmG, thiol:disulfide interchange protein DsbE